MKRKMLDLCAGFGGQSEGFLEHFDVLRIDNNPLLSGVPNTVIMDLYSEDFEWCFDRDIAIEYIHAGPTCTEFSLAYNAPAAKAQRNNPGEEYLPVEGIRLVQRCVDIINGLNPRYWSIENVKGSAKFLNPILGKPMMIIGAYVYWGNFPMFEFDASSIPKKSEKDNRNSPLRANYRAKVPLKLSQAFFHAMDEQRSILEYC